MLKVLPVLIWGMCLLTVEQRCCRRETYKYLGLGQVLPTLFCKQINCVQCGRCSLTYLAAPETVVGSPQAVP